MVYGFKLFKSSVMFSECLIWLPLQPSYKVHSLMPAALKKCGDIIAGFLSPQEKSQLFGANEGTLSTRKCIPDTSCLHIEHSHTEPAASPAPSQSPHLRHGAFEGAHSLSGPSVAPDTHTAAFCNAQVPCSLVAVPLWRFLEELGCPSQTGHINDKQNTEGLSSLHLCSL